MSQNNPLISIVIPTYNGEAYIEETLNNILSSEYKNFEILCVDDLSTDHTYEIIERYTKKDNRIKLLSLPQKGGNPAKSIVFAIPYCKGEYFFYMSQDDLLSSDCLSKCIETAIKTKADAIIPNMIWYYSNNEQNEKGIYPIKNYCKTELSKDEAFLGVCSYTLHGFALKKMNIMKKYPYDTKFIDSTDISTAKQYYLCDKVALSEGTFFYRQDNTNALTKKFNAKFLEMLDSRIDLINFAINHNIKNLYAVSLFYLKILKLIYKDMKYIPSNDTKFKNKLKETTKFFRKKMLYTRLYFLYFFSLYIEIKYSIKSKLKGAVK